MLTYKYEKVCRCGNIDYLEVSRLEAAFELRVTELLLKPCQKCGGKEYAQLSYPQVEIDQDLLMTWANNVNYQFMPQDEEIVLAEAKYIDMILHTLDNSEILTQKHYKLLEALCVFIYDSIVDDECDNNQSLVQKVASELRLRRKELIEAEPHIYEYIKAVVFPFLGFDFPSQDSQ